MKAVERLIEIAGVCSPGILHYADLLAPDVVEFSFGFGDASFEVAVSRAGQSLASKLDSTGRVRFSVLLIHTSGFEALRQAEMRALEEVFDQEVDQAPRRLLGLYPNGRQSWLDGIERVISGARMHAGELAIRGHTSKPPGWIGASVVEAVADPERQRGGIAGSVYKSVFAAERDSPLLPKG